MLIIKDVYGKWNSLYDFKFENNLILNSVHGWLSIAIIIQPVIK